MSDQSASDESLEELLAGFLDIIQKYMPMIRFIPVPKKMTNSFCRTVCTGVSQCRLNLQGYISRNSQTNQTVHDEYA
jgi:hypothetical protein